MYFFFKEKNSVAKFDIKKYHDLKGVKNNLTVQFPTRNLGTIPKKKNHVILMQKNRKKPHLAIFYV